MSPDDRFDDSADQDLLARLRAADPVSSLPAAPPAEVTRLLEDTMNSPIETPDTSEPAPLEARRSRPLLWLGAAAVAAVVLVAGFAFWQSRDPRPEPMVTAAPTVSHLEATPAVGRCAVPSVEVLQMQEVAFDGVVTTLADGVATLEASHWYRGAPTDLVEVKAPGLDQQQLLDVVAFQVGDRYLVAGHDGSVAACGVSGPYSDDLAGLYSQAFGG